MKTRLIAILMAAGALGAAPILINNTGLAAPGAVDPNWTITSPAGSAFVTVVDGFPIGPWLANTAASSWVQPSGGSVDEHAAGTYTYQTTFSLAGLNAGTAQLNFRAAVDNDIAAVRLNGNVVGFTYSGFGAFSSLFAVTNAAWFNAGVNTLQFDVVNAVGPPLNPTGFRVEISGTAAVTTTPEPSTLLMAAPALLALALRRRR